MVGIVSAGLEMSSNKPRGSRSFMISTAQLAVMSITNDHPNRSIFWKSAP